MVSTTDNEELTNELQSPGMVFVAENILHGVNSKGIHAVFLDLTLLVTARHYEVQF
jgi:hypothetical protein